MDLKGKVVLVTGGAKRVGERIVRSFAEKEATCLIHCNHSVKEAEELAGSLRKEGKRAFVYQANLSKMEELNRMADQIISDWKSVDVLVNNASVFYPTPFEEVSEFQWSEFIDLHMKAPFFLSQRLVPLMKKKGGGRVISFGDWTGLHPLKRYLPYCLSKAGLIAMGEGLAKEFAPEVLVNTICPGPILPPENYSDLEKEKIASKTLVKHWGDPNEIAKWVVMLAESDFVTGQVFVVDGGDSIKV